MGKQYLMIDVVVTLDFTNVTAPTVRYSGSSAPGGDGVVTDQGAIDLTKVKKDKHDKPYALISFTFETKNAPSNMLVAFTGMELTDHNKNKYSGPELVSAVSPVQVVVLDLDLDGATYNYCLKMAYGQNAPTTPLPLDPPLVNRNREG